MKFRFHISNVITIATVVVAFYAYDKDTFNNISKSISILQFAFAMSFLINIPISFGDNSTQQSTLARLGTAGSFAVFLVILSTTNLVIALFFQWQSLSLFISVISLGTVLLYINFQHIFDRVIDQNVSTLQGTLFHLNLRNRVLEAAALCRDPARQSDLHRLGDELQFLPNLAAPESNTGLVQAVTRLIESTPDANQDEFAMLLKDTMAQMAIIKLKNLNVSH